MKGYAAGIAAALMWLLLISGAAAQEAMRLYVEKGALEEAQIRQMLALLDQDDTRWMLMEDERPLRELVLAGDAPDLAVCAPAQVRPWAREGILLELQRHIGHQQRKQRQVLDLCQLPGLKASGLYFLFRTVLPAPVPFPLLQAAAVRIFSFAWHIQPPAMQFDPLVFFPVRNFHRLFFAPFLQAP